MFCKEEESIEIYGMLLGKGSSAESKAFVWFYDNPKTCKDKTFVCMTD